MDKITTRFWFHSKLTGREVEDKLKSYGAEFIEYDGDVSPYNTCSGGVIIVFDNKNIHDFDQVTSLAADSAAISQVLVRGGWIPLKDFKG